MRHSAKLAVAILVMLGYVAPVFAAGERAEPSSLTLAEAVVLGIVEGATEYLPVSSTGHLVLVQQAMGVSEEESEAANALAICIQSGAILAVLWLYWGRFRQMLRGIVGADSDGLRLLRNLIVAFLPAAVFGLLLHDWIKERFFAVRPIAAALFVGGLLILGLAQTIKHSRDRGHGLEAMSWRHALCVGLMQCLAFWPGFSRSLATILGCILAGFGLAAAVEFSFLLGLITLSAATVLEGLKHGPEVIAQYGLAAPLLALVVAFVSAVISVRFMLGVLTRFGMAPFGYYRILLAAACLLLL